MRAESKAATAVAPAPSAAAGQEHEQLKQYGVFKLSYDTANVSGNRTRCLFTQPPVSW